MTQLEEYEALVEAIVSSQRYVTGAIFKSQCPYSQWTVCIDGRHAEFYNSPVEAYAANARANARAALAVIAEKAKEWPTGRMRNAYADAGGQGGYCAVEFTAMFAASPLIKPEDPK